MASSAVSSAPAAGLTSLVPVQVAQTPPSSRKTTKCLLPYIDPSHGSMEIVKSEAQPSPSSFTNDFLPQELLLSLKRHGGSQANPLSPPKGGTRLPLPVIRAPSPQAPPAQKTGISVTGKPPANVWNHPHRRARLKHLTDAPPCICGAGKDISFLYDANTSSGREKKEENGKSKAVLPNTLIPEEYHIVKNPGVLGLEYHDDPFSTRSEDHDHHMTVFPSMRPAGRHEAVALKHTLDLMLQRAGVPSELKDSDLNGPTAMHNLVELIQKEQTIYNICFHELIRQVSVHCVERGELLADIRRRYSNLLDRIPRQVKSLHDEVVAQRSLDRKLTSELKRFKTRITSLTDELSNVREHDLEVTEASKLAEDNLSTALADSEKNANLLAEYHALYELQRKRLEDQVDNLTMEKELWQQASYDLSLRVAEEGDVQTVQRLQLGEKAWCKLAGHFTVLLTDRDTQQLTELQGYVQDWRDQVGRVVQNVEKMEENMKENLSKVLDSLAQWESEFNTIIYSDETFQAPNRKSIERLYSDLKIWEDIVNEEAENFTGDILVNSQEELKTLTSLVGSWTEISLQLFSRHQMSEAGENEKDVDLRKESEMMKEINAEIDVFLNRCGIRLAGENGVATGFVRLTTPFETWDTKLSLLLTTSEKKATLPESDWIKFKTLLKEWREQLQDIISFIGVVEPPKSKSPRNAKKDNTEDTPPEESEEDKSQLEDLILKVEKWRSAFSYAIESQDTQNTEQVSQLHSQLVKWMVELLLALTGTQVQQEENFGHKQHISTTSNLNADYSMLAETINSFTKKLTRSCMDVVREVVDVRRQEGYPNPEEEQDDLKRLGDEAQEWAKQAGLLLKDIPSDQEKNEDKETEKKAEEENTRKGEDEEEIPKELPDAMNVIGVDDNIHPKSLQQAIEETETPPIASSEELGLATEQVMPEGRGAQVKDVETLIVSLDEVKSKLKEQEELTEQAETKAKDTEKELDEARKKIAELEEELQQTKEELEQRTKSSGRNSKASSKSGHGKRSITKPLNKRPTTMM